MAYTLHTFHKNFRYVCFCVLCYVKWTLISNIKEREHASKLSIFLQFLNFDQCLFKEDCFITSFFLYLNSNYFLSYLFVFPILNLHLYFQQFTNIHTVTKYTCSSPVTHFSPFPNSSLTPALLATTTLLVAAVAGSIPHGQRKYTPHPTGMG
jgi:hypothetical protein